MELNVLCERLNEILAVVRQNPDPWKHPAGDYAVKNGRIVCPPIMGDNYWYEYAVLPDGRMVSDTEDGAMYIFSDEKAVIFDAMNFWLNAANTTNVEISDLFMITFGIEVATFVETGRDKWLESLES